MRVLLPGPEQAPSTVERPAVRLRTPRCRVRGTSPGPAPGGPTGPAVAAGAGSHSENARLGHHLPPFRPEVVVDDLHDMAREERPDV